MSSATKLEPLVHKYVTSDAAIRSILGATDQAGGSIEEALALIHDFINGRQSANGAFLSARGVDIRGLDTNLCILFLASWAHACFIQSSLIGEKRSAAWTLVHRARALASESTEPEVIAYVDIIESRLIGSDGNHVQQEETIRNTLTALPHDSPRRKFAVIELATILAQAGRLSEINSDLNLLSRQYTDYFKKDWITALQFINAVETGQLSHAARLIPELAASEADSYAMRQFRKYRTLMELMRDDSTREAALPSTAATNESDLPDWALVIHCILTGSLHQALRWARLCEKKRPVSLTGQACDSYNLIRSELAEGNSEAAKRIIDLRRENGNIHYIDDFFLARIEWLEGNKDEAIQHFTTVLKASDRYKAGGRLDFEVRLASELPRDALLNMTRTSGATGMSRRRVRIRKTPSTAASPDYTGVDRIIGSSRSTVSLRETILNFAPLDVPVLITGETGTGKEVVARALHEASPRKSEPFVAINCGAISESLLESELFGHEKGAFSGASTAHQGLFEEAGKGTIFLDEIGEISARLQVVLLRVLETAEIRPVGSSRSRKITCRILASTNADLEGLAAQDRFRRDVLFRLRRLEIHMVPLHDRDEDSLELADYFLNLGRAQESRAILSDRLVQAIQDYSWPGNIRELRNTIERMRLMNSDKLYYDVEDIDIPALPSAHPTLASADNQPQTGRRVTPAPINRVIPTARVTASVRPALQRGRSRIRRIMHIRELFARHELLTRSEIVKTLDVSPNTATHDLKELCNEGYIERIMPSASPRSVYFVLKKSEA